MSKLTLALAGALSACALNATAAQANTYMFTDPPKRELDANTQLSISMGWLQGKTSEFVYKPDTTTLSQLDWHIKPTPIAKVALSWDAGHYLTFGLNGWTTFSPQESEMDDYDWKDADKNTWSDHSFHPNTTLHYANSLESSLTAWLVRNDSFRFGLVAGYQISTYSWSAMGGQYSYDNGQHSGNFADDKKVASVKQRYDLPYVGLSTSFRKGDVEWSASAKYSNAAKGQLDDAHYLKGIDFQDRVEKGTFYAATLSVAHYTGPRTKMFAELGWNYYEEARGQGTVTNANTKAQSKSALSGVGMSHQDYNVTFGLQYLF